MFGSLFGRSKNALIRQLGSSDNRQVLKALEDLKANGWFRDGSLRAVQLENANLQGAALAKAEMQQANLQGANLTKAYLGETHLKAANLRRVKLCDANMRNIILIEADLSGADLSRAYMPSAILTGAVLMGANLTSTNFWQANLGKANLHNAVMTGANLFDIRCDEQTILPDGTFWTNVIDWGRFTDPAHPHFWQGKPSDG